MPELLPGAGSIGILTAVSVIVLRARADKPRLALWRLVLIGVVAAYVIPPTLAFLAGVWTATPWLPALPVVTSGQVFLGVMATGVALTLTHRPGSPPNVPVWAGLLIGIAVAAFLPPLLDRTTGSFQRASLRADVNHCMSGLTEQAQPYGVVNICDEPVTVGLCLPGETNPTPCEQSMTLQPGDVAQFDPRGAGLASLPSNPNGFTVVACRPPARPSRMVSVIGRGHEGVCLPPG